MALAMAALFAVESAPATITAEAAANWRELLADLGAPSAGGGSRFGPIIGIPGATFGLDRLDG